jgi:hypothetical protein
MARALRSSTPGIVCGRAATRVAGNERSAREHVPMEGVPSETGREDLKGTTYEFFILALSILSIVNMVLASSCRFSRSRGCSSRSSTPR